MPTDQELIKAVLSGDVEAFTGLVRTYQARVRLVCLARLHYRVQADDAAQDIFVKAFQSLSQFKNESSFQTWLIRIADNHCIDLLRAQTRSHTESLDALWEAKGDAFEALLSRKTIADNPPPNTPEDLDLLGRLFAAMPEEDRDILTLREVEELSYEEIAQRLNCSLDAVKGRLKRARQTLLHKWKPHRDDER